MKNKSASFFGGMIGLVAFIIFGALPSIVYGGYAGVALATALFSPPLHEHLLAQGLIIFGMLVGTLATAGMFVIAGSVIGIGFNAIANEFGKKDLARKEN